MERRSENAADSQGSRAPPIRRSRGHHSGAPETGAAPPGGDEVPLHEKAGEGAQGRRPADDAPAGPSHPGGAKGVGTHVQTGAQRTLPHVRPLPSWRENGSQCPGDRVAQDDLRAVRRLQLPNPSNFCYSNASFLSILWTHYLTSHQGAGTQNCDLLGPALKPIWSWLRRQTRPETPWQHLAWRALHCGWHQPARQHDVGEYLAFLTPHLGVAACGTWESRLHMSNQPVRCVESGDTWPLLLQTPLEGQLHPPATSISLQSLLDTWSLSQEGKPGLVRVPAVLCLQINRFNTGLHLDPKSSLSVEPEPQLLVPYYASDLQAGNALQHCYAMFRRSAAILHIGPRSTEGHYRCMLFSPTDSAIFLTEDNQPASLASPTEYEQCQQQTYVFLCPVS